MKTFNLKSQLTESNCPGNEDAILDVMYDPNNKALVTCGADKTFRIFQ